MTNKLSCCEKCKDYEYLEDVGGSLGGREVCKNPHCPCHTSPLQNLIRGRETAFAVEWVRDDGILDVGVYEVESLKKFLRESIRLAFLAGMEEARSCVPEEKQYELMQDGVSNDFGHVEGWKKCRAATLAAIEKKSREVGEGLV